MQAERGASELEFRQLSYFIEVAKQQSFSKAGVILHITQPTMSKSVKTLEDELGVQLLERSTKKIRLTDAGEVVYKQAQQVFKAFDNLASELADVRNLRKGQIRLGIPPMVGAKFFPKVLAQFNALYPDVTIQLIEDGSKIVEQFIEEGHLDLGVAVLPVNEDVFDFFIFAQENLRLLVHPSHAWATRSEVRLSELRDESFILFREDFTLHNRILCDCQRAGFEPNVVYKSSQWDFIAEMVAENLGIALLPESICKELDPTHVKIVSLLSPSIPWNLGMIWRKDKYLSFATRKFISFMRSQL